jgi:hypothetical protein
MSEAFDWAPLRGPEGRELAVRRAHKEGRSVAVLRAVDCGESCLVELEIHPVGSDESERPAPHVFAHQRDALAFVSEAVEALLVLGCDIAHE